MTAGNSTPLSDGASAVLLASEQWAQRARAAGARLLHGRPDRRGRSRRHKREGLLMAPAYAMPRMLDRTGLALQDFDLYEIHEAFAAQVLCTLRAWEDPVFCRERLGRCAAARSDRPRAPERQRRLARRRTPVRGDRRADRRRARQGAVASAAPARGVISICAAAGQGVVAVLEALEERNERPLPAARPLPAGAGSGRARRPAAPGRAASATAPGDR